jgi:alpha-galactosidase
MKVEPALLVVPIWLAALCSQASTNTLAPTPPMGWNTWYCFVENFDASTVRGITDAMATNGLQAAGYQFINLDGCYWAGRDASGDMIIDTNRFPGGMAALGAYVHARGFKFGAYADASTWPAFCGATPSYGFETNDVASFVRWEVDFLKVDNFGGLGPGVTETAQSVATRWRNALLAGGRPVVLSLSGGYYENWKPELASLFRISTDINQTWQGMTNNLDLANRSARFAGPGRWNDPDMLCIGNNTGFSDVENRAYFSLWCITASPLILSSDVRSMTPATKAIVTAPELIALDQDPLGAQGIRISSVAGSGGNLETWCKELSSVNAKAVALFNSSSVAADMTVHWTNLLLQPGPATVRDLWARAELGVFTDSFTTNVPSHGAVVLKITGTPFAPPVFLSALPYLTSTGAVNFDKSSGNYYGFPVLSVADVFYPHGIEMEAPAAITYDLAGLNRTVTTFVADIGIDKDSYGAGSATFQVWADGVLLLETERVTATNAMQTILVDLAGRQTLTLVAIGSGHADWGDARILAWPQPQLLGITQQPDGGFTVTGAAAPGQSGVLVSASGFVSQPSWTPVSTNIADLNGAIAFPNLYATNDAQRFFRLRSP